MTFAAKRGQLLRRYEIVRTKMLLTTGALMIVSWRISDAQMMSSPPVIATTAVGEARVTPDRATIFVGVQSRAQTAAAAGADNARRHRAILDTLRTLGISG